MSTIYCTLNLVICKYHFNCFTEAQNESLTCNLFKKVPQRTDRINCGKNSKIRIILEMQAAYVSTEVMVFGKNSENSVFLAVFLFVSKKEGGKGGIT